MRRAPAGTCTSTSPSCSFPLMPETTRQRHHPMFLSSEPFTVETGYFTSGGRGCSTLERDNMNEWMNEPEHLTLKPEQHLESKFLEMRGQWRTRILWISIKMYSSAHFSLQFRTAYNVPFAARRLLNVSAGLLSPDPGTHAALLWPLQKDNWASDSRRWWHY